MVLEEEVQLLRAKANVEDLAKEHQEAWAACNNEVVWLASKQCYGKASSASTEDRIHALKNRYQAARSEMERESRRVRKLEDKVKVVCAGHWQRNASMQSSIHSSWTALGQERLDQESYSRLMAAEDVYAPIRLKEMKEMVQQQRDLERQLQSEYKTLIEEEDNLKQQLQSKE